MTTFVEAGCRIGRSVGSRGRRLPGSVAFSIALIAVFFVLAAIGLLVTPGATSPDLTATSLPAGTPGHIFGTDALGRDVLALSVAGARSALVGPLAIALGSMACGILFGTLAAYRGGWIDAVISRACEVLLSMPVTLLAIVVAGLMGSGYWMTVLVLILLFAPSDIRMLRAATLQQLPQPYIESAFMLGLPTSRILFRHILPNVVPIIRANVLTNFAFALVSLSGLSYLGVGVKAGAADWGLQLSEGRQLLFTNPAAAVVPGVLIILAATAVNIAGDWWASKRGGMA